MLCSATDSQAKLLPSDMNRPLGNFLQRRAPTARDAFPETEIMFPLLPDSRMDTWSGRYTLDSPPDSLQRRSPNSRAQGLSSSAARGRIPRDGGSARQASQRLYATRDGRPARSVSSGFFKRIFRGAPRKYSVPPEPKDTSPELSFSEVMMRYHQQSPDSGNSFGSATKKSTSERKTMPEVVPAAPPTGAQVRVRV
ncbi:hypothetical protein MRX96_020186 [Rhipicephalus microplus]